MDSFPKDVLAQMFRTFPENDRLGFRLVCKKWKRAVNDTTLKNELEYWTYIQKGFYFSGFMAMPKENTIANNIDILIAVAGKSHAGLIQHVLETRDMISFDVLQCFLKHFMIINRNIYKNTTIDKKLTKLHHRRNECTKVCLNYVCDKMIVNSIYDFVFLNSIDVMTLLLEKRPNTAIESHSFAFLECTVEMAELILKFKNREILNPKVFSYMMTLNPKIAHVFYDDIDSQLRKNNVLEDIEQKKSIVGLLRSQ